MHAVLFTQYDVQYAIQSTVYNVEESSKLHELGNIVKCGKVLGGL